jgi:membrane protease YdiL (CAAX protease family)
MFSNLDWHVTEIFNMETRILKLKACCLISPFFLAQRYSLNPVAGNLCMHTYLRNKPAWLQLIIFGGLTVGILLLCVTVGINILAHICHLTVMQIANMGPADYARPENAGVMKGILIIQDAGLFILPPLVYAYLADPRPQAYAGLKAPQKNYFLVIALVTMIAGYFTVEFLGQINESIIHLLSKSTQKWIESGEENANGMLENIISVKKPSDLLVAIFYVAVLPAIGEELFFRGILQKFFIQIFKSAWPGIIFTGFLFSAFHMQFMGFLPRMALGIILGALYWFSGSIFTSMLGHFVFNSIGILLIYFKVADLDSKPGTNAALGLIGVVSLAFVVFLLNYLRKKSTTTYAAEFPRFPEVTIFDDTEPPA